MKDLEKAMMRQYNYQRLGNHGKTVEAELAALQKWTEDWVLKKSGKLTISVENEIKQILDKIRSQ
ncbi:MAG: hypothetical protein KGI27_00930 [Thaumarchaeota archaeon]|nr:hypothetical protein [Nitrososphaerota archaeon]